MASELELIARKVWLSADSIALISRAKRNIEGGKGPDSINIQANWSRDPFIFLNITQKQSDDLDKVMKRGKPASMRITMTPAQIMRQDVPSATRVHHTKQVESKKDPQKDIRLVDPRDTHSTPESILLTANPIISDNKVVFNPKTAYKTAKEIMKSQTITPVHLPTDVDVNVNVDGGRIMTPAEVLTQKKILTTR